MFKTFCLRPQKHWQVKIGFPNLQMMFLLEMVIGSNMENHLVGGFNPSEKD